MTLATVSCLPAHRRHLHALCKVLDRCCDRYEGLMLTVMALSHPSSIAEDRLGEFWNLVHAQCRATGAEDELDRCVVTPDGWFRYCFSGNLAACNEFIRWDGEMRQIIASLLEIDCADKCLGGGALAAYFGLYAPESLLRVDVGHDYLKGLSEEKWTFLTNRQSPPEPRPAFGIHRLMLAHDAFLSLRTLAEMLETAAPPSSPSDYWKAIGARLPYGEAVERLVAWSKEQQGDLGPTDGSRREREEDAPYQMLRRGAMWLLCFAGGEPGWCPHHDGLEYYAKILSLRPGARISSSDVMGLVRSDKKHVYDDHNEDENKEGSPYNGRVRITEKELRKQIKSTEQEIKRESEKPHPAIGKIQDLVASCRKLEACLKSSEFENRKSKSEDDHLTGHIRTYHFRARRLIAEVAKMPVLANHLQKSVCSRGNSWYYKPDGPIKWQTDY